VITLPSAVGIAGRMYVIKKSDLPTGKLIISGTSLQTIDGATSVVELLRYISYTLISDNSNWFII